ncbi:MAG TPA: class I SAM-dependent methyltransferase [Longimicrobium sp.]|nr:class I SAM-dependent methyltransferase [Longimicrobium sp.]
MVEILELNRRVLVRKGYRPIAADFLRFDPGPVYNRILANPPFRLPGLPRAYQAHIRHAWDLLAEGGVLVSVAPAGVLHAQRQDREFHRWLADRGRMEELPDGSFEASGTGVATALITLEKRSVGWKRRPFQGWVSWNAWQAALWADNTSELYQEELRIYERIRRGDFGRAPFDDEGASWPLAAAARAFYEEAAEQLNRRPLYAGVYLSDKDHRALLRHLADRFREYESYRETHDRPVRIAA